MDFQHINLAAAENDHTLVKLVDDICRETVFVVLEGHSVKADVIGNLWGAANQFFAQSSELKQQVKAPYAGYPYGYLGPNAEALAKSKGEDTPPDLKESINGGPLSVPKGASANAMGFCYHPTLWPELDGFRAAW